MPPPAVFRHNDERQAATLMTRCLPRPLLTMPFTIVKSRAQMRFCAAPFSPRRPVLL